MATRTKTPEEIQAEQDRLLAEQRIREIRARQGEQPNRDEGFTLEGLANWFKDLLVEPEPEDRAPREETREADEENLRAAREEGRPDFKASARETTFRPRAVDNFSESMNRLRERYSTAFRDSDGKPLKIYPIAPMNGDFAITSTYSPSRRHPIYGTPAPHEAGDMGPRPRGARVAARASMPGIVLAAGPLGGYGNRIDILGIDGVTYRYAHLARYSVRAGQSVDQGMDIGIVGNGGISTAPHLHYEEIDEKGRRRPPQFSLDQLAPPTISLGTVQPDGSRTTAARVYEGGAARVQTPEERLNDAKIQRELKEEATRKREAREAKYRREHPITVALPAMVMETVNEVAAEARRNIGQQVDNMLSHIPKIELPFGPGRR